MRKGRMAKSQMDSRWDNRPNIQGLDGLDKDSSDPLYIQLAELIRRNVKIFVLKPGERLPNEDQIAERYKISRVTVRKALSLLEDENVVIRRQGKGTFVPQTPPIIEELGFLDSLSNILIRHGIVPRVDILSFKFVQAPPSVVKKLKLPEEDHQVLFIARRHVIDEDPVALALIYLPYDIGQNISQDDVASKPIYALLQEKRGISLKEGKQTIWACPAEKNFAKLLRIRTKVPLLMAERVTYGDNYQPLELIIFMYRADRYEFYVNLPWTGNHLPAYPVVISRDTDSEDSRVDWQMLCTPEVEAFLETNII
jgi:GntR family transcriptional regulator